VGRRLRQRPALGRARGAVSYSNLIVPGGADAELRRFHHDVVGPYWPPGREHVENGYGDLVMPWPAVEAPPLEMTAEWTRDEVVGYVSSWSAFRGGPLARGRAARGVARGPAPERMELRVTGRVLRCPP
jgi:hypothetical protein